MTGATTPSERYRLGYRPELDGLRAIAVLAVMGYHFKVPGFDGGGGVGVQMFFVLSGFLITSLLREELRRTAAVSIPAFYLRRARRLLPALMVLVAVVMAMAAARGRIDEVWPNAAAVLLYVGNWAQHGDPISLEHLSHAWSLGVEEQFYAVWPWIFVIFRGWPVLAASLLVIGGASARIVGMDLAGLSHVDGLMIGCLLGLVTARLPSWMGVVALLAIGLLTVVGINPIALVAVAACTALVIAASPQLLGWGPLAAVGRISYGLYLWHFVIGWEVWPSIAHWPWYASAVLLTVLSFAFALASWRYVEQPFLRPALSAKSVRPSPSVR